MFTLVLLYRPHIVCAKVWVILIFWWEFRWKLRKVKAKLLILGVHRYSFGIHTHLVVPLFLHRLTSNIRSHARFEFSFSKSICIISQLVFDHKLCLDLWIEAYISFSAVFSTESFSSGRIYKSICSLRIRILFALQRVGKWYTSWVSSWKGPQLVSIPANR